MKLFNMSIMRKLSIIALISSVYLFTTGCKKGEISGDFKELGIGSYITNVAIGNQIIDYSNLGTAKVDVTVREYGSPVSKIKLFVTKGAATTNTSLWKAIKEVPYSGDTKLEITATEIATALGIPLSSLERGSIYTIYNQVHSKDGQIHDISNTGSGFYGNPNYNMLMTWQTVVVCPYNPAEMGGLGNTVNYRVLTDGWGNYSAGDIVQVTIGPGANQLTFPRIYLTNPFTPVVANVNPANGLTTIAAQNYGQYLGVTYNLLSSGAFDNLTLSCIGIISLNLTHRIGTTSQGTYRLRLQKI
jgi:hypothetical protein